MSEQENLKLKLNRKFGTAENELPVEAGRYVLLISLMCPWGQAVNIIRKGLGLDQVISLAIAYPVKGEKGWEFPFGTFSDKNVRYLPDEFENTLRGASGLATVPSLYDKKTGKIVQTEPREIAEAFENQWKPYHSVNRFGLILDQYQDDVRKLNDFINLNINKGVYNAGLALSQEAYDNAYATFFESLDELEGRLQNKQYLFGNIITDSDIWLFVTLVRFDVVYYSGFKVNRNRLADFPNLWRYVRDLYSITDFRDTTDFENIKKGYYLGQNIENVHKIVPDGPDLKIWNDLDRSLVNHDYERRINDNG